MTADSKTQEIYRAAQTELMSKVPSRKKLKHKHQESSTAQLTMVQDSEYFNN